MGNLRIWLTVAAIGAVALAYGWGRHDGTGAEKHRAEITRAAMVEAARERERQLVVAVDHVARDALAREQELAAVAADAGADLRRLQQAIVASGRVSATTTPVADGGAAGELLGECAGQLLEMAGKADRYANQLIGLQGYVGQVCVARGER